MPVSPNWAWCCSCSSSGWRCSPARLWSMRRRDFRARAGSGACCAVAAADPGGRWRSGYGVTRRRCCAAPGFVLSSTASGDVRSLEERRRVGACRRGGRLLADLCCWKTWRSCRLLALVAFLAPGERRGNAGRRVAGQCRASAIAAVAGAGGGGALGAGPDVCAAGSARLGAREVMSAGALLVVLGGGGGDGRPGGLSMAMGAFLAGRAPVGRSSYPPPARGGRRAVPRASCWGCSSWVSACRWTLAWSGGCGQRSC
jgi:hypothetical protein